jgi:hypothetical protein
MSTIFIAVQCCQCSTMQASLSLSLSLSLMWWVIDWNLICDRWGRRARAWASGAASCATRGSPYGRCSLRASWPRTFDASSSPSTCPAIAPTTFKHHYHIPQTKKVSPITDSYAMIVARDEAIGASTSIRRTTILSKKKKWVLFNFEQN